MSLMEKCVTWAKQPLHALALFLFLFALILRLYYFNVTSAVWWDEAEYLNTALRWAFDLDYPVNPQRPPLLSFLLAGLMLLGSSELLMRLLTVVVPSIASLVVAYFLLRHLYADQRVALVTTALLASFWLVLFNVTRFHVEMLVMLFQYLALYFFWRGYVERAGARYLYLMGVFLALAFLSKFTTVIVAGLFLLFALLTDRLGQLKEKPLWLAVALFLLVVSPYLLWASGVFGSPFAFLAGSDLLVDETVYRPIAWGVVGMLSVILGTVLSLLVLVGLVSRWELFVHLDEIFSVKKSRFLADTYLLFYLLLYLSFFIFFIRTLEDRWILPAVLPLFVLVAHGLIFIVDFFSSSHKHLPSLLLVGAVLFLVITQVQLSDRVIEQSQDSYLPVKEASFWIRDHAQPGDVVKSGSTVQMQYYTRLPTIGLAANEDETKFLRSLVESHPRFLVLSVFERHPEWLFSYVQDHPEQFHPVQVYSSQGQPVLVIYEIVSS